MFVSTAINLGDLPRPQLERHLTEALSGPSRLIVLKGGVGSGKSTLLRRVLPPMRSQFTETFVLTATDSDGLARAFGSMRDPGHANGKGPLFVIDNAESQDIGWIAELLKVRPVAKVALLVRAGMPGVLFGEAFRRLNTVPTSYVHVPPLTLQEFMSSAGIVFDKEGLDPKIFGELFEIALGNPEVLDAVGLAFGKKGSEAAEEAVSLLQRVDAATLLGPDGQPIAPGSQHERALVERVLGVDDKLIAALAKSPHLMYSLEPRKFEELVAELMERDGYKVTLTQQTRDDGRDVIAIKDDGFCRLMLVVECKRYASDRPVGIGVVQRLAGVVHGDRANAGIVATTSHFSRDALRCREEQFKGLISLRDYMDIHRWLKDAAESRGSSAAS